MKQHHQDRSSQDNPDPLEAKLDRLFKIPLAEFVGERNALAAQLKREQRMSDAEHVKGLAKPPLSAWAVNQLYWMHRAAFDRLIESGRALRQAPLMSTGESAREETRKATVERRTAISELVRLADDLLRRAGHSPTQEMLRRIGVTLEALSALPAFTDCGRLTADLDPPGFDLLAGLAGWTTEAPAIARTSPTQPAAALPGGPKVRDPKDDSAATLAREAERQKQLQIAQLRKNLSQAESVLKTAQKEALAAEDAMKKSASEAMQAESRKNQAREAYEKALAAFEEINAQARRSATEADSASARLKTAEQAIENLRRSLRALE